MGEIGFSLNSKLPITPIIPIVPITPIKISPLNTKKHPHIAVRVSCVIVYFLLDEYLA